MDWLTWWRVWCSVWQRPAPKPPPLPPNHGVDVAEVQRAWEAHIASQREVIRNAQRNADDAEKLSGDLKALVDMMEQRAGDAPPSS